MTTSPRSSAGRTTVSMWCARSAAYSSASARGATSPRWCRTMSRIRTPTSVPPGSRVRTTVRPRAASHSSRSAACVVLPTPSPPSNVTNRPDGRLRLAGPPSLLRRRLASWSLPRGRALGRRTLGALVGDHLHGDLEGDVGDGLTARDRHVRLAVGHVRAEPAVAHADRLAADRVVVELVERAGGATGAVLRQGVDRERLRRGRCRRSAARESSVRESVPFFRYGPYRPFCAVIGSPDSGSVPTVRGSSSRRSAVSRSIVSTDIDLNSEAVRGFGAASFFAAALLGGGLLRESLRRSRRSPRRPPSGPRGRSPRCTDRSGRP